MRNWTHRMVAAGLGLGLLAAGRAAGGVATVDFQALTMAIADVESGGNPFAVGKAGERGLMQIKQGTWQDVTRRLYGEPLSFTRAFDPELNLRVGRAYLNYLAERLASADGRHRAPYLPLLVASYNRGPGAIEACGYALDALTPEAADYVGRVLNLYGVHCVTTPAPTFVPAHTPAPVFRPPTEMGPEPGDELFFPPEPAPAPARASSLMLLASLASPVFMTAFCVLCGVPQRPDAIRYGPSSRLFAARLYGTR